MSKPIEVTQRITVTINGKAHELTKQEAKALRDKLDLELADKTPQPWPYIPQPYPVYIERPCRPVPYWYGTTTGTNPNLICEAGLRTTSGGAGCFNGTYGNNLQLTYQ